jgi:arylsulfatase A-like enzyme
MYDESYRTPLLVRWPDVVEPGTSNSELVSNLDFAQTFLQIAQVPAPEAMQGASLVPILKGEVPSDWREYHYYHYYEYPGWHMVQRHEGVYDGRYKLIHFYDLDEWELIDLEKDPHELTSHYYDPYYSEVKHRMLVALERLKLEFKVPEGIPEARSGVNPAAYYSTDRLALEQVD